MRTELQEMHEPIRVLHCVAGLGRGGYETFIMNVYRHIDRTRVQFDFLYSFDGVFAQEIQSLGGRTFQIPFITQKGPFVYRKAVRDFLKSHGEYKIVHSHMDKFSGLIMECAKEQGIPVRIAHSHSTRNEGGLAFQLVKDYYGKKVLPNCTDKMACSDEAYQWMFGTRENMQVVKNGIDTEKFTNQDNRNKALFTVVNVGRFAQSKNHEFLIEVFQELYRLDNTARLVLAGTGALLEKTREMVQARGLSGAVTFLEDCDDVAKLLTTADVVCMPSLFEGLPVSLVEAQSAGVPCVISDRIPAEANITGTVTFLSLEDSPQKWAEELLKHKHQKKPDNRQKLVDAGYDIRHTAKVLQDFYLSKGGEISGNAAGIGNCTHI